MASRAYDFSIVDSHIDPQNSTISKVSLISLGRAKGHETEKGEQIWVDGKSLEQIYSCLTEMGTLKLKVDHGSGVMSTAGWIDGFEKTGGKILGDMHVYDAEPEKMRMFEIAQKNPDHLGLSLEFSGDDEILGNKAFARCDEVSAVALVSEPAANSSLFEKSKHFVDNSKESDKKKSMATKKKLDVTGGSDGDAQVPDRSKMFDDFCKKYADDTEMLKKFDDFLTNSDGRAKPKGTIDPNVVPVVVNDDKSAEGMTNFENNEKDEDKKDDDKKDDKVNEDTRMSAAVDAAVEKRMKQFAASLGTKIPPAGTGVGITNGKGPEVTFESAIDAKAEEFGGDRAKATLHLLELVRKQDPDTMKLYAASRSKFLKVEPKANRYL